MISIPSFNTMSNSFSTWEVVFDADRPFQKDNGDSIGYIIIKHYKDQVFLKLTYSIDSYRVFELLEVSPIKGEVKEHITYTWVEDDGQ